MRNVLAAVMTLVFVATVSASASAAQPIAPYYATFYYPWFATPNYGGNWGHWAGDNNQHSPPQNWFSNYLPSYGTTAFDPSTRVYGIWDDHLMYWQLQKMAEARIGVAISSWWGQHNTGDNEFRHIVTDVMKRPDGPYPNLKWAILYEQEAFSDPSVSQIVSDLNYISTNYASQPGYLRQNGKPVIFVYGEGSPTDGTETTDRWTQANAQAQSRFYVVASSYNTNFATDAPRLDSWFHYDTTHYQGSVPTYSQSVSPGFWKADESVTLPRDLTAFKASVASLVSANVLWKLIATWNEWGEGSSVEPADQVNQTTSGSATLATNAPPFQNSYVNVLSQALPPLRTGACTPAPPGNVLPQNAVTAGLWYIRWKPASCFNHYLLRIDDLTNGWVGDCGKTQNAGDVCRDDVAANGAWYNFQSGHQYHIWVHAINSFGILSDAADSNITYVSKV